MDNKEKKVATGIFLTDEALYFAQVSRIKDELVVDKLKTVPIQTRSFLNGKIRDVDSLTNQIVHSLGDEGFNVNQIVVGFSDTSFLKHIEKFPSSSDFELKESLETRIQSSYSFVEEEIVFGFQKLFPDSQKNNSESIDILFAISEKNKVMGIKELLESIDLNLIAFDLEPLAVIRAIAANNHLQGQEMMSIYINSDYLDLNILLNGEIIHTYTIKKNISKLLNGFIGFDDVLQRIQGFVMSYENRFPHSDLRKILIVTALDGISDFTKRINEIFVDYDIESFDICDSQFRNIQDKLINSNVKNGNVFLPVIGLALKYFEPYQTVSLIKIKRQIEPIIRPFEIMLTFFAIVLIILLCAGTSVYLSAKINNIQKQIEQAQNEIRIYSTGEYIQRQQKLQELKAQITYYDQYSSIRKKTQFFESFSKDIPDDVSMMSLTIDETDKVQLNGTALLMSSLNQFYNNLTDFCKNVEIIKLNNIYVSSSVPYVQFQIICQWDSSAETKEEAK